MPSYTEYKCSCCGRETERILLTVKTIVFKAMGAGAKVHRSRVAEWLCDECLPKDVDWNRQPFRGTPGLTSEALERVRAAQLAETSNIA